MVKVNSSTDSDLKCMFDKLYNGFLERKEKLKNNVCMWEECAETFSDCESLYSHVIFHPEIS